MVLMPGDKRIKKERYDKCNYPGCIGNVLPGRTVGGLCARHTEQLRFLVWALDNIVLSKEAKTNSGLIIPNRKEVMVK